MRWWSNVANSLFLAALTAIVLAALQPVFERSAPSNRLRADVTLSPWVERPNEPKQLTLQPFDDPITEQSRRAVFAKQDANRLASIRIQNPGKETVSAIRLRFQDEYEPDVLIESEDGLFLSTYKKAAYVNIPDMKPGEIIKVFVWNDIGFEGDALENVMMTYSTQGPFDLHIQKAAIPVVYQRYRYILDFRNGMFISALLLALVASGTIFWLVSRRNSREAA